MISNMLGYNEKLTVTDKAFNNVQSQSSKVKKPPLAFTMDTVD